MEESGKRDVSHNDSCADAMVRQWITQKCARGNNPFSSRRIAIVYPVCTCARWGGRGVIVCVFVAKPRIVRKSGATVLRQWARAKVLKDPDLTWPLTRSQRVSVPEFGLICACVSVNNALGIKTNTMLFMNEQIQTPAQSEETHTHTHKCTHVRT